MGNDETSAAKGETNVNIDQGEGDDIAVICCTIFCFHGDTKVYLLENKKVISKSISEIKKGDIVFTFNEAELTQTKIKNNIKNEGSFNFYEIKCKNEKSEIKIICLTWNHTMIVYDKSKREIKFKLAKEIKVGDNFRGKNGFFEVFEINNKTMNDCYELTTEKGTVLANDILVSTIYLNNNLNKNYQKIIDSSKIRVDALN